MDRSERREAAAGLALAAVGVFFAAYAWRMPAAPDPSAPGPGAAPGALGLLMLAMGVVVAATALLRKPAAETTPAATPADDGAGRKLLIAAGLLAACVIAFEPAGFMLSTFLFLLAGFMLLGGADWRAAAPAAALASGGLWMFFTKLLGVGLPYGFIGEILFR
jgi:putative tricarboxylic transport membrane protein